MAAYRAMPADRWDYCEPDRWAWIRKWILERSPNKRVLDVGCFRADFLDTLPDGFAKFGVEPNSSAAAVAEGRGVKILGSDVLDELKGYEASFGTIILMDVAEHLVDPAEAFKHLEKYLSPGGILIVLTGNSDHWITRLSLPYYWYMSFPIHLVYLSVRYFKWFSEKEGWELMAQLQFSHQDHGFWQRFREYETALRIIIWRTGIAGRPWLSWLSKSRVFRGIATMKEPPLMFCIRDHVGVVLTRNESTKARN